MLVYQRVTINIHESYQTTRPVVKRGLENSPFLPSELVASSFGGLNVLVAKDGPKDGSGFTLVTQKLQPY
jgi:hypothetical protein